MLTWLPQSLSQHLQAPVQKKNLLHYKAAFFAVLIWSTFSCGCTAAPYCNCRVDILQAFLRQPKLLETSILSDIQQRAKGLVFFHVSKAYSPASAYGNCCGIISKGVWSRSALTLQWFGAGEGKDGCQNNSSVPTVRTGAAKGSCIAFCGSTIFVLYLGFYGLNHSKRRHYSPLSCNRCLSKFVMF